MITSQKIEALAFQGKCKWQMFYTGYTGTYTIPVPAGGFVLLRQIIYNAFYQGDTKAAQIANVIHQVTICEQGSKNELLYIFRDTLNDVSVAGATHFTPGTGQQIIETWGTFKKNICIDVLNAGDVNAATFNAAALFEQDAQERPDPLGFATIAVTPSVNITAAEKLYPTGEQRQFSGAPYTGLGIRDRLRYNATLARALTTPNNADPDRNYQFPIIGFGAWVFNIGIDEYLNSGN
jgi:hypothetical protein